MRISPEFRRTVAIQHNITKAVRLRGLLKDLHRTELSLLEAIEREEHRTRRNDPNDFDYSTLAKSLRSRLNNLRTTIARIELELAEPVAA